MEEVEVDCDINTNSSHKSVVDRYFIRRYKTDLRSVIGNDHCILVHSNKICVITLAASHPILKDKKTVVNVNFQVEESTNRLDNKVSGKGKRGAQSLSKAAALCHVTCSDDSVYTLCSCVKGNLIEVNTNLLDNPELITKKPETEGYIAMVLTSLKYHEEEINRLKTEEEYQEVLKKRAENG